MKLKLLTAFLAVFLVGATAHAELKNISNSRITLLRVHDVGTAFGPNVDQIDVEVVIQLAGQEGSFGFQLRDDAKRPARQGMLDLLRDAFNHDWLVNIDFEIDQPNDIVDPKNGVIIRVWLTKPAGPVVAPVNSG